MSILETALLSLVLIWTPGIVLVAYLLIPRRIDQNITAFTIHTISQIQPSVAIAIATR